MEIKWKETFLLHSKTKEFQKKINEANEIIYKALKEHKKPYIAFSGGKDSTCMLDLILKQKQDIVTLYWDYGEYFMPREIHQEIINNAKKMKANLRIETSFKYKQLGKKAKNIIGSDMIGKLIPKLIKEGFDVVFVGLREEESSQRRLRLSKKKYLSSMKEIWPLQKWTWIDIWAYIVSNNLPYIFTYDIYAKVLGWHKTRFVTFFDPEFDKLGSSNIDGVLLYKHKYLK